VWGVENLKGASLRSFAGRQSLCKASKLTRKIAYISLKFDGLTARPKICAYCFL